MQDDLKKIPGLANMLSAKATMKEVSHQVLWSMKGCIERTSLRQLELTANGDAPHDSIFVTLKHVDASSSSFVSDVEMKIEFDYDTSELVRDEETLDVYKVWSKGISVEINVQDMNRRTVDGARKLATIFQRAIDLGQRIMEDFSQTHVELYRTRADELAGIEKARIHKLETDIADVISQPDSIGSTPKGLKVGANRTCITPHEFPLGTYEVTVTKQWPHLYKYDVVITNQNCILYTRTD